MTILPRLCILLCVFGSSPNTESVLEPGFIQQTEIVRVVDEFRFPVPFALVSIDKRPAIPADTLGRVRLNSSLSGGIRVKVQRLGYSPFEGLVNPNENGEYIVVLGPLVKKLDTVRTIAETSTPLSRTGFYDRMRRVRMGAMQGDFLTSEELEQRGAGKASQLFHGRRFVSVSPRGMLQGRGGCFMQILLDGRPMEEPSIDDVVGSNEIMAIEIYPSNANAPSELITVTRRGSCGIVAIWTGGRR